MAGGFRVTEDGSQRVDQLGQLRLTQEFFPLYATSTLDAVGTVIPVGGILLGAFSALVSSGLEVSASTFTAGAVSYLNASGEISPTAEWYKNFLADLNGITSIQAKAGYIFDTSSGITSTGTIGLLPDIIRNVSSDAAGSLALDGIPSLTMNPQVSLGSTVTSTVTAVLNAEGRFNGVSTGSLGADSTLFLRGLCDLQANSTSIIYPQLISVGLALVGSSGSVTAYGGFLATGIANLNSIGTMNGTAYMIQNAIVSGETLRRVTEDGGVRIVYSGDFRSVVGEVNLIASLLTVTPTIIPFAGSIYGQKNGEWGLVTPNIKQNGEWVIPKIYVNNNNTWKRVS